MTLKSVVLCSSLLMVVWVSLSTGQTEAPATTAAVTEAPAGTEAVTVTCSEFNTDQTQCCAAGNPSACTFSNCSNADGDVTQTVCVDLGSDPVSSCEVGEIASDNLCITPTSAKPETSAGPTAVPTTEPATPTVNCVEYSGDQAQCCLAGDSQACVFYNCTTADNTLSSTVCAAADATPECDAENTPSSNICQEAASSTPASGNEDTTQAPSSGGVVQGFDAASFIGGIVLCAGILVIAFFGHKFYISRQEKTYRSM